MHLLTDEQKQLNDHLRDFGRKVVYPKAAEWDAQSEFPWPILEALQEQRLLGMMVPAEYGGLGFSVTDFVVALEAMAASSSCGATVGLVETHSLGSHPILIAANDEQKKRWLPEIASGESLCAFSLTEPESGSDAGSIRARARLQGDHYVINAHKCFCTLGGLARYITVFAKTQEDVGVKGISAFVVDTANAPGFHVGRTEQKMGLKGNPTVELFFDDVAVPVENRLGKEGDGFKIAMETLIKGRLAVAADSVGMMEFAINYAANYARERTQFGRPLADLQAIQFMLAEMEIRHETARHTTYAAAELVSQGTGSRSEVAKLTAIAKCYATDVRQAVLSDAIQIMGGYGYMKDHPLERIYRDSKIYQIFDGTNQVQRVVIARAMLG